MPTKILTMHLKNMRANLPQNVSRAKSLIGLMMFGATLGVAGLSYAENPIITHTYTADPAARVFNGRMYVIASHDPDNATDYSTLVDYNLISTDDMVNWQDHGIVFNVRKDTKWATMAYAPEWILKDNKYYLFFPDGANSIGVAVADKPEGPYVDHIGKPLIDKNTPNSNVQWLFDPGVLVDDDGKAYVYFGGGGPGNARVIEISADFKSVKGPAITMDPPMFFEAPYIHKRNGLYYFTYSTNEAGKFSIDYMTSRNPTTGFQHRGTVLPNPWEDNNNNNHSSIIEWQNQWYMFYHNRAIANARGKSVYQRSINVDLLSYGNDGSMSVNAGPKGVPQIKNFNPYTRVQAETMAKESGIEVENASEGTLNVQFNTDSWIKVAKVDFGAGAVGFEFRVAATADSQLEIILDNPTNPVAATVVVKNTGGLQTWATQTAKLQGIKGVHDVYYRAKGRFNLNWYQFISKDKKANRRTQMGVKNS